MPRPERHAAFDALLPALAGKTSVIFHTASPHDTLAADRIGREFGLDVVVSTSSYEAEYGDALAAAERAVDRTEQRARALADAVESESPSAARPAADAWVRAAAISQTTLIAPIGSFPWRPRRVTC